MRVLIVARSLPFHRTGGMEVVTWDLACALRDIGIKVVIMTTRLDAEVALRCRQVYGITIEALDTPAGEYSSAWWTLTARYAEDNSAHFDVVLGVSAAANAMVSKRANGHRPIYVFQAHGTSWGEFISKWRQRCLKSWLGSLRNLYWGVFKDWIYRRYDGVVAISDLVDAQLRVPPGTWLRGSTPLRLIANGIPEQQFCFDQFKRQALRKHLGLTDEDHLLLSLCRLHPQKGLIIGLEAFAKALERDSRLYYAIVGDGPQLDELVLYAKTLSVSDRVHFIGRVERHNVPEWYCAADVFLFPTQRVEGLTLNLFEALATGLPIVASEVGCEESLSIKFVPKEDVDGFCEAILYHCDLLKPKQEMRVSKLPPCYYINSSSLNYVQFFEALILQKESLSL